MSVAAATRRRPRVLATAAASAVLLAGPTILAFFAGGYFATPRAWAGLTAWTLVLIAIICAPGALSRPFLRSGAIALAALALFAGWTLLSTVWAPEAGPAYGAGQIVFLYLGAALAGALLLRERRLLQAVEPALAAGAVIVIGYGLSERLLPGLLHFAHSVSAEGRLEQPLTYWNAMGELAAIGFVMCARIAGDAARSRLLRAVAAAACAPLGMGLYITFSRGALFACAAGLVALIVLAPRREQLHGMLVAIGAGVLSAAVAAPLHGVTALAGSAATRERQGALALVLLVAIAVASGGVQWWLSGRERSRALAMPRHSGWIALIVVCAGLALAIVLGSHEGSGALSGGATRLVSLQSNRYAYWRVALKAFGAEPVRGVGAGGWAVWWLRYRPFDDFAQDAHSLPLQTLAELGLVGVVLLGAFVGATAFAARDAIRAVGGLAAGPIATLVVYAAHAPLDWDWQMPAVTLVAMVLVGALIAAGAADRAPIGAGGAGGR